MKYTLIACLFSLLYGCYSKEPEKTGLEGKEMPSFKIILKDSTTYLDMKTVPTGKPTVLFYFSPYCPYSRAQFEEMIEEKELLKSFQVYLITPFPHKDMLKFYSYYHLEKFPNFILGRDYSRFVNNYFKVVGVPYTAIYDDNKKLIKAFEGKIYTKQIVRAVQD